MMCAHVFVHIVHRIIIPRVYNHYTTMYYEHPYFPLKNVGKVALAGVAQWIEC